MKKITTIAELQTFTQEKIENSLHHARDVYDIIPQLIYCIINYGSDWRTKFRDNDPYGNLIWFKINEDHYCVAYSHKIKKIELRKRGQGGEVIALWDNETNPKEINEMFIYLKTGKTIYDVIRDIIQKKIKKQKAYEHLQ